MRRLFNWHEHINNNPHLCTHKDTVILYVVCVGFKDKYQLILWFKGPTVSSVVLFVAWLTLIVTFQGLL